MVLKSSISAVVITISLFFSSFTSYANDEKYALLSAQITSQNYQAALETANSLLNAHIGEPEFDYLYGLSELMAGDVQLAIFAFERAIESMPNDTNVRFALAKSYYQVKNWQAAQTEFQRVLQLQPSPMLSNASQNYLASIQKLINAKQVSHSGHVFAGLGFDSNVNSGISDDAFPFEIAGADQATELGINKNSDLHYSLGANYKIRKKIDKSHQIFFSTQITNNKHKKESNYDTGSLNLSAGTFKSFAQFNTQITLFYQKYWYAGKEYHDYYSLIGTGNWQLNTASLLGTTLNLASSNNKQYDLLSTKSINANLYYQYTQEEHSYKVLFGMGSDKPKTFTEGSQHYERQWQSLTGLYALKLDHWGKLLFQLKYQNIDYQHKNVSLVSAANIPVFNNIRSDDVITASVKFIYPLSPSTDLIFSTKYLDKESNQFIYQYDKNTFTSQIRYHF